MIGKTAFIRKDIFDHPLNMDSARLLARRGQMVSIVSSTPTNKDCDVVVKLVKERDKKGTLYEYTYFDVSLTELS